MPDAARDAFDDTLRQAIDAEDTTPPDPKLAGAVAAYHKIESLFALLRAPGIDTGPEPAPERLGRYLVRDTLGHGAFATVYLADDPELSRQVAIKLPRSAAFATPRDADAFLAEARLAARLSHPQIVAVYDAGRQADRAYIVIEYVPGQTLEELARGERPSPARAAELLAAVADALAYAHQQGFVHRDLKPSNILIDAAGRPHVADFGLAVSDDAARQLIGQIAGTPAYMSPEQARGDAHQLDGRSDIWSLGVIGYELLTGRQPFWRGDVAACLDAIASREPKPPRQLDAALPVALERIVLKCLAKHPADRYTTASDLASDLRRWLATTGPTRVSPFTGRSLTAAAVAAAFALALFAWRSFVPPPNTPASQTAPAAAGLQAADSPTDQPPLSADINVRIWSPDDASRRGLALGDVGALPLRAGDQVRVEAKVDRPSYLYIVWIDAAGEARPVYPWRSGDWHARPTDEQPVGRVSLPDDPSSGWPMSGPSGVETLLVLARRTPLPRAIDLAALLAGLPHVSVADERDLLRLDEAKFERSGDRAPDFSAPRPIDDAALAARKFLTEQVAPEFDLIRAVSFSVRGQ